MHIQRQPTSAVWLPGWIEHYIPTQSTLSGSSSPPAHLLLVYILFHTPASPIWIPDSCSFSPASTSLCTPAPSTDAVCEDQFSRHSIRLNTLHSIQQSIHPPFFFFLSLSHFSFCSHRLLEFGTDGLHAVRVPDDNVSIRSHRNPAFTWVQVEDFCSVGWCDCHKLVFIHLPHGLGEQRGGS